MNRAFKDQLGHQHIFSRSPQRIVSLVPSQTELLHDLGLEQRLVGITKFCVHPYHLKATKKIVGGTKSVHLDRISELQPDLIVANKEENTLEMVEQLRSIAPVWVTDVRSLEDNAEMIASFGELFDCRTEALKWNDKIGFAHENFMRFMQDKPVRRCAYFIWKDPYMVAGGDTFIDELLRLNRFENIYRDKGRYPEVVIQKMRIQGDPELILLSSEPFPFKDEHAFELGRFTHHAKTVFVDGEMFSWYGSRLVKAFDYFRLLQQRLT